MRLRCPSVTKNIMKIRYHLPSSSRSGDVIHPSECVWRFNKIAAKTRNFSISYRSFSWYSWKIGYQTNGQSLIASDNVRTFRILCTRQTTFLIPLFSLSLISAEQYDVNRRRYHIFFFSTREMLMSLTENRPAETKAEHVNSPFRRF